MVEGQGNQETSKQAARLFLHYHSEDHALSVRDSKSSYLINLS
jgi:hypothetical protein